jgi:REP element-mobilizing transposase RayT
MERRSLRIVSHTLMPDHWHFVVRPKTDDQLSDVFRWLTQTHTMRWHAHSHTSGTGHLYQGRFKTFPIEGDDHFLAALRSVERNPLRAGLCERAEDWKCGSARRMVNGDEQSRSLLSEFADSSSSPMAIAGQQARGRVRSQRHPPLRQSGNPLRQRKLDDTVGSALAAETHSATAGATEEKHLVMSCVPCLPPYFPFYSPLYSHRRNGRIALGVLTPCRSPCGGEQQKGSGSSRNAAAA